RNAMRTVAAAGRPRRAHARDESMRRSQNEQLREAKLAELESAKAELARQNVELVANRATLEFERQRYEELFNFAPDGYVVTNLRGDIQDLNMAACRLLHRERDSALQLPFARFFAPADRAKILALPLEK